MFNKLIRVICLTTVLMLALSHISRADDPCDEATAAVAKWALYITGWSGSAHSANGQFSVTPRVKDGVTRWYEISYGTPTKAEVTTVIPQLEFLKGTLNVSVERSSTLLLDYLYGAGGHVSCHYQIRPTRDGFEWKKR